MNSGPATVAVKKTSVRRACDNCRFRKIKCSLSQPCKACVSMGFDCTFLKPQKKRGPPGHRVSQIRQQQSQKLSKTTQAQGNQPSLPDAFPYETGPPPVGTSQHEAISPVLETTHWPMNSEVTVPVNLASSPAAVPIASPWGTNTSPINSDSTSGVIWNERNDAEYWLPDNLDTQGPVFDFPGTNIYLKSSLPSIVQPEAEVSSSQSHLIASSTIALSSLRVIQSGSDQTRTIWPPSISEANMIPWIDIYFDRLHPTLPVLNRSSLFTRMLSQEHRRNHQFGSMLLSLCAFSLTQPIEIDERPTSSSRANQALSMMNEATKMRSFSEFGERPTIESVLTSFFLFGCLFGSNQHSAAWLRLREALELAATLGLNNPDSYRDLPSDEKGQRLRTYLVLSITERAYALQRRHSIAFWGRPGFSMRSIHDFIHSATHNLVSGIIVHNEKDAQGMMGLARLMDLFDAIDEDVVDCWNQRCNINSGYCEKVTEEKALSIHQNLSRVSESELHKGYDWFEQSKLAPGETQSFHPAIGLSETQCADVFITKKWLQNRVWVLCSTHGLLRPVSDHHELCFNYAISIAIDTLKICQSLCLSSMEAHGIGLIEKLYDIAISANSVSFNVRPYLKNDLVAPTGDSMPGPAVLCPGSLPEPLPSDSTTVPPSQSLAEDFLLLLTNLRGGNHPFLGKYKAYLSSLRAVENGCNNWTQEQS